MSENSKIAWTNHTFNPWWGCTKVSAGCNNCYAETLASRFGFGWGQDAVPRLFGEKHWNEPLRWNRQAEKDGARARVFCGSMCDVFEARQGEDALIINEQRTRLWRLIEATPSLDWLLLTKRPENVRGMVPTIQIGGEELPRFNNVWLGATVENQRTADERIPLLLQAPAVVTFLSMEPLLEAIDLSRLTIVAPQPPHGPGVYLNALTGHIAGPDDMGPKVDWVIVGGESGPKARPCDAAWIRSIVRQCREASATCFVKQLGAYPRFDVGVDRVGGPLLCPNRVSPNSNPSEWPDDLRVRQFPVTS